MRGFHLFLIRKKVFAVLLILISCAAISWFIFFEYTVRWLEKQVEVVATNLTKKGFTLSYSKVEISGNPLFLRITFQNPALKDPKGYVDWKGSEMILSLQPWQPYFLTCSFPGQHTFLVHQALHVPLKEINIEGAVGTLNMDSHGYLKELNVKIESVKSLIDSKVQPVFLNNLSLKATKLIDPLNLEFSFSTDLSHLETLLDMKPLDYPCTISLEAHLAGYQPNHFLPRSLAEWRDGGGVMEVTLLKFSWPPIIGEAKGTLTLDKNMYPLGSFSSQISGYQDALAHMVKLGWVKKKKAAGASFVLDLLSVPDESGTRQLTVPITLQNGRVSVGPAPLLKLQPVQDF